MANIYYFPLVTEQCAKCSNRAFVLLKMSAFYFYFLCNAIILVLHTFVFNWKNSLEIFKKVHRNE